VLLYDSFSREKVELPAPPGPIRMYFCGPTVYQRIHVGNARPLVIALWMRSWLRARGYDVTLVENVTDVNDKIYEAAAREGIPSVELAEKATRWHQEDTDALGLGRPDARPLASETIAEIVSLIGELVDRDLAYESAGDVYFRVAAFPDYGKLSGADPDEMVAQEPSDLKEDPRDFALWKANKPQEDTWWESPWGHGRPGWHIECSAMAEKCFGPEFEIHGGGLDLRFPHHENEIAQSRGAGRPFAQIWAHNGLLRLDEEKMSKSTGNIVSLREVLDTHGREALLVFFLGAHWRSPIDYSDEAMEAAQAQAESFRTAFRVARLHPGTSSKPRSTMTSTRPRRSHSCTSGVPLAGSTCSSEAFGSSAWGSRRPSRLLPRSSRSQTRASARGESGTSRKPTACATRSPKPAGRSRTSPTPTG
jgi:cysteinyl-tRNA synthetase